MQTIDRFSAFPGGRTRYFSPSVDSPVAILKYGSLSTSETRGDLLKALIDALSELPVWVWMQRQMTEEAKAVGEKPLAGTVPKASAEPAPKVDKFAAYKRWKATREANQAKQYARTGERVRYSKASLDAAHVQYQKSVAEPQREKYAKVAKAKCLAASARGERLSYRDALLEAYDYDVDAMRGPVLPPAQVDRGTAVAVHRAIKLQKYARGESVQPWWERGNRTPADAQRARDYALKHKVDYNTAVAATA